MSKLRLDQARALNEAARQRKKELGKAIATLGGSNSALVPNYASNDPMPTASLPVLEKAVVENYERKNTNPASRMSPLLSVGAALTNNAALKLANDLINDSSYQNQRQQTKDAYNDIKNREAQQRLESVPEISTMPTILGMGNGAYGLNNAGVSREDAQRYFDKKNREKNEKRLKDFANAHPVLSSAGAAISNPIESIEGNVENAGNYLMGKPLNDTYTPSQTIRETVTENINSKPGRFLYGVGNSMADMGLATLIGAATGNPNLAAGIMGLEKSNQTMNDAVNRGLNPDQIVAEGALSGVSTALTERVPLEKLLSGDSIIKAAAREGGQEALEDIADSIFDEFITRTGNNKEKSDLSMQYQAYINAGYSEDEARKAVRNDYLKQLGLDALAGAISGGGIQGGSNFMQGRNIVTGKLPEVNTETETETETNTQNEIPRLSQIEQERNALANSDMEILRQALANQPVNNVRADNVNENIDNVNRNVDNVNENARIENVIRETQQDIDSLLRDIQTGNIDNPRGAVESLINDMRQTARNLPELSGRFNEMLSKFADDVKQIPKLETAQPDTSSITSERENRDLLNLAQQYKDKLSVFEKSDYSKEAKSQIKAIDNAIKSGDMNAIREALANADNVMQGAEMGVNARQFNKDSFQAMQDATDGYKIKVNPKDLADLGVNSVTELDGSVNTGSNNRLHFVKSSNANGFYIDEVYDDIREKSGYALPSSDGMNTVQMLQALRDYISQPKAGRDEMVNTRTWNDIGLSDSRPQAIIDAEQISDKFIDDIIADGSNEEIWTNYLDSMSELATKYPELSDQITDTLIDTYQAAKELPESTIKLDDDIKNVQTVEEAVDLLDKEMGAMSISTDFFSQSGSTTESSNNEEYGRVNTGRQRVSDVYSNTGKNSDVLDPELQAMMEKDGSMLMTVNGEKESLEEAQKRLKENGVINEYDRLMKKDKWHNVDVDEAMTLMRDFIAKKARLDEQGLDSSKEKQRAYDLFVKIKNIESDNGAALQALAKWSRNCTAEGLLAQSSNIINRSRKSANKWFGKVRKETKNKTDSMDIDFMFDFLEEARKLDNLTAQSLENRLREFGRDDLADELITAFEKLANADVNTADRANAMNEYDSIYKSIMRQMEEENPEANGIAWNDMPMEDAMDSVEAKHIMANLGKMVNSQIPITMREKITTLLMDNMLGNVRTLLTRNAGGNIGFNLMEDFIRQPISALIDRGLEKFTGQRTTVGLSKETMRAAWEGFKSGLAQEIYDFKNDIQSARSGETTGDNNLEIATANNRNALTSKIGHLYNKLVKAGLSFGDRPFYEKTYRKSMAEYEQLYKMGKITDINGEILPRKEFEQLAKAYAQLNALTAVYQDNSSISDAFLKMKEAVNDLSQGIVGTDVLSQFTMPFVKTPANIIQRAIEYSPVGIVKNAIQTVRELNHAQTPNGKLDFNQQRFVTEASRNIVGTALFVAGMALAQSGKMTGAYDEDKDMRQAQKEAGMQEYALHNPFGLEADVDVSWIPVLGNNLVASAAAYDAANDPELSVAQQFGKGATAGLKSQFESSMLQGLQRLVGGSGSFGNDGGDLLSNSVDTLKSGATQFIPSILRQTAAAFDPYQRQLAGPNPDDYYLNSVLSAIPGLRDNLQPKIGRTGEDLEQNHARTQWGQIINNYLNPATVTYGTPDAVRDEAMRLYESTGNNIAFQPTVTMSELKKDDHIPTAEEFTEYQKNAYGSMNSIATDLINSDYYQSLNDGEKEQLLADMYSAVKTVEKKKVLDEDLDDLSGAAKAFYEDGDKGLIKYMTARNVLSEMGMQNNQTNRDKVYEKMDEGGTGAVQEMVDQAKELEEAGLNTNMQFKYEHAQKAIPSLSPTQFADTWNTINTDNNSSIKIDEVIAYLNKDPKKYNDQTAQQVWNAYYSGSSNKLPVLDESTGLWKAK